MSNLEASPQETACGGRAMVAVEPVREVLVGRPVALGFWYRQSPRYLVPFSREEVTQVDPPRTVPGMANVMLDVMHKVGIDGDQFGDSTGTFSLG